MIEKVTLLPGILHYCYSSSVLYFIGLQSELLGFELADFLNV